MASCGAPPSSLIIMNLLATSVFTHYNKVSPIKDLDGTPSKVKSANIDDAMSIKGKTLLGDKLDFYTNNHGTLNEIDITPKKPLLEENQIGCFQANKGASGAGTKLEIPKYDASKLQHEFKHASDFGVNGNWNSANGEAFKNALNNHVSTSDTILQSTYRGSDVVVYINNATGNGAYYDLSGNFIGGWKFSAEQLQFHIKNGVSLK